MGRLAALFYSAVDTNATPEFYHHAVLPLRMTRQLWTSGRLVYCMAEFHGGIGQTSTNLIKFAGYQTANIVKSPVLGVLLRDEWYANESVLTL